jgi:hypothetical protein
MWALPFRFSSSDFIYITKLLDAYYMPCPLIFLDLITLIIFNEDNKLQGSSFCNYFQSPVTSSVLGPRMHPTLNLYPFSHFAKFNCIVFIFFSSTASTSSTFTYCTISLEYGQWSTERIETDFVNICEN